MKRFFKPQNFTTRHAPRCEDGYALMMVVFFTALMLVAVMVAAPRILQEGKREKRKGNDLARGSICPRREIVLPQDGTLSDVCRGSHQAKDRHAAFHAASLQRSDERRGWFLAADLCGAGRTADWEFEAPANFATADRRARARHCCFGIGQQ